MSQPFDDFIIKHKAGFDTEEPSMDVWERIAVQANIVERPPRRTFGLQWVKYAAAAVVVISTGIWAWNYTKPNRLPVSIESPFEAQVSEAARYYESEINKKQQLVLQLTANQPEISEGINNDMAQLDSTLAQLRQDLGDNVANTEVLEAMIQNYRLKLSILEEVLGYLKTSEEPAKQKSHIHES
ncbi:MAG: hypothetical protein QM786_17525 [Breznakibacter sp.]